MDKIILGTPVYLWIAGISLAVIWVGLISIYIAWWKSDNEKS